ncbi:E3 ubiquitin-protein ligase synoviolin [Lampetra fluviatilis]
MRLAVLSGVSALLTSAVVLHATYTKRQFYPTVVYLTKSSPCLAVLYLQAFVLVFLLGKLMRKVFFGQLRAAETEHLIERSWYAVTETCLAFTVFRDDVSPRFVALFTLLLFLKCFHWLAEDRVDFMERSPVISWLFHIRVFSLMLVLSAADGFLVHLAYYSVITRGASVQLVFGFEYAILLTMVLTIFIKYLLHTIDLQSENPWDNKAVYMLYTELFTGLIKVLLYGTFMTIMIKVHTFPLFAIRPMYLTMRQFKKAVTDAIMSRRAIRNMNTLYPDATPEELAATDNVCIICREEMVTGAKRLPCNHIFHTSCLRSWFQRQQTCPTCRMDILRNTVAGQGQGQGQAGAQQQNHQQQQQQQQQQQPHQQQAPQHAGQNQPNLPQGMMPPFPGMFPLWPPMGPVPIPQHGGAAAPHMPARDAGTDQGSSGAGVGESAANGASASANALPGSFPDFSAFPPHLPPLFMPGFAPPQVFGLPPMPTPPDDLGGLSEEELRAMEGTERRHLEARVRCLRNIQTLLDAAVMQMQQYSTLVATLSVAGEQRTEPTAAGTSSSLLSMNNDPPPASTSETTPTSLGAHGSADLRSAGVEAAGIETLEAGAEAEDGFGGAFGGEQPEESTTQGGEPSEGSLPNEPDANELRRRRLQKLESDSRQ